MTSFTNRKHDWHYEDFLNRYTCRNCGLKVYGSTSNIVLFCYGRFQRLRKGSWLPFTVSTPPHQLWGQYKRNYI